MKKFFLRLASFFVSAAKLIPSEALDDIWKTVDLLAKLTPNRSLDQLMAVASKYGVDVVLKDNMTWSERGGVLFTVAVATLAARYPGVPVALIGEAVQEVYNQYKDRKTGLAEGVGRT